MKERFLLIETSTEACSVAVAQGRDILCEKYVQQFKVHASMLAPFIHDVLLESGTTLEQCAAVSVSGGPGSYTGLRVGVSTAKGLCFGSGVPLISIGTLDILAHLAADGKEYDEKTIIVPMVDARRMEVYTSLFNHKGESISTVEALILNADSFSTELEHFDRIVFIGDGCEKFKAILPEEKQHKSLFLPLYPRASAMILPTLKAYENKKFEDSAYFEPFYLKEFVAGITKKTLI